MVSLRCKIVVKGELQKMNLPYTILELGTVEITDDISESEYEQLKLNLLVYGFELLNDRKMIIVEKIKKVILEMIHYADELPKINYSDYISKKLNYDYTYLSNLFSEVKGMTIQQFIMIHKIEKVKELLLYNELNLTEISYKLYYSSVAHLANVQLFF